MGATAEIVWEEPPPPEVRRRQRGDMPRGGWGLRLMALMQRPGDWARIAACPTQASASSTTDRLKKRPLPGVWEFVSRSGPSGAFIYARYIGPEQS